MNSREKRFQYIPYVLALLGVAAIWYGYSTPRLPFILIGIAATLGAILAIVQGYTATHLTVLFGGISVAGFIGCVYVLVTHGVTIWAIVYLLLGVAGGVRARQYWHVRPWSSEASDT